MKPRNIGVFCKSLLTCGLLSILCVLCCGCQEARLSSSQEVAAFEQAGPIEPKVDLDKLLSAKKNNFGVYTVGKGDVLEIQMPTIITAVSPKLYNDQQKQIEPYLCRVSDSGTITLPIIGQIDAEDKTLAQIEEEIVAGYYPKYVIEQPSVVCGVKEYHLRNVTVVGAVMQPGVYQLRSNEMSLVAALMKAGGIVEGGASLITIKNPQRKYVSSSSGDDVKQLAELGGQVNEQYIESIEKPTTNISDSKADSLDIDLAFQPARFSTTKGNLIIQRDGKTLYSKNIDLKNQYERENYIQEIKSIVGDKQAYITGEAIKQLAEQLSPSIRASQTNKPDMEETELIETASESKYNDSQKLDTAKQGCSGCAAAAKRAEANKQEYIEPTPVYENTVEPAPVTNNESVNDKVNFIEPVDTNYQPMPTTSPVATASVVEPIVLPVKGLNIPFADVPLTDGDLVEVKMLNPSVFTVIGLAKTPGAFPYPPDVEYNLMQAIGFAGGVDMIADPRFVTIYRQDAKGNVVSATFRIDKKFMAESYKIKIKPGDVISIDITSRTRTNVMLNQMLRLNFGLYVNPRLL